MINGGIGELGGGSVRGGSGGGAIGGYNATEVPYKGLARMAKKRVFVSFDFDNDKILKEFIVGQAKLPDAPFEIVDCSLKEAAPMKSWEDKARAAIKGSDIVLVMVGPSTHKAPGVLKEVKMARDEGIPICQVIGYKDGNYTAVPDAGRLYSWNWENLKKLLG